MLPVSTLIVLVIKYLSIYRGHWIANLCEEDSAKVVILFEILFPLLVLILEFGLFTNVKEVIGYKFFHGYEVCQDDRAEFLTPWVYLVVLPIGIALQTRIELDYLSYNDGSGCFLAIKHWFKSTNEINNQVEEEEGSNGPYKLNALRFALLVGIGMIGIAFFTLLFNPENLVETNIIFHVLCIGICPSIFVLNHPGLKNLAKAHVRSLYSCQNLITLDV